MYSNTPIYLNEFRVNFKKYINFLDTALIDYSMLIHGRDSLIVSTYLKTCIDNILSTNNLAQVIIEDNEYGISKNIIYCDAKQINNTTSFVKYVYEIAKRKTLFGGFMYVVIEEIGLIPKTIQNILSRAIDTCPQMKLIVSTTNSSSVHYSLSSRMVLKRIPCITQKQLVHFCDVNHIEVDRTYISSLLRKCDDSIYPILLTLETGKNTNIIQLKFNKLLNSIAKCKRPTVFIQDVRDCVYSLLNFNIPKSHICKELFKCSYRKYKKNVKIVQFVIEGVGILEHRILLASKPLYHFEYFFVRLFFFVKKNY